MTATRSVGHELGRPIHCGHELGGARGVGSSITHGKNSLRRRQNTNAVGRSEYLQIYDQ